MKYDLENLLELCKKNNTLLLKDYTNDKITPQTKIKFKCNNCNKNSEKGFRSIIDNFVCKECTSKIALDKRIETNLNLYGSKFIFSTKNFNEKVK